MGTGKAAESPGNHPMTVERASDREMIVRRTFDAPAHLVFEAWTRPELFARWWVPKSFGLTLLSIDMDVRVGGTYRLVFSHAGSEPMAFFGKYLEVVAPSRLVWSNDESATGAITTVSFEETDGRTLLVMRDLYPSKQALEDAIASGSTDGMGETFKQLDEFLATRGAD